MLIDLLKNMFLHDEDTSTISKLDINDVKDEDLDSLIEESELAETDGPETPDTPTENANTDEQLENKDKPSEEDTPPAEKKEEEEMPLENEDTLIKEPLKEEDTQSIPDPTILSEDMISAFDDKDRKTLERYVGKPIDTVLKTMVEQKRMIGKGVDKTNLAPKPDTIYPNPVTQPKEATELKDKLADQAMSAIHDDYPTNNDEWNYLLSENALKANQYLTERSQRVEKLNADLTLAVHVQENFADINVDVLSSAGQNIENTVKALGVDVVKDLGIDVKHDLDSATEFLDSLLVDRDGKLDLNVFETWERNGRTELRFGVPQIKEGALEEKFIKQNRALLFMKVREKAFVEGVAAANSKSLPPSFSNGSIKVRKTPDKVDPRNVENIDELDKLIEESENT